MVQLKLGRAQFLQNSAQFHVDYTYFQVTTDADRLATAANNPTWYIKR